jgi:DNA invertase Pin-like site-specific DNA recombinase
LVCAILFGIEIEAYPEPKILSRAEKKKLLAYYGSTVAVARFLGCSQSFVSERLNR